ncbi:hypothetical protein Pcinc_025084 [Petrolisthes cinctipes]|uniref:BAR domain-containing protein n=1 Tax=Petrolisthes cinctipes TaxID=88211 RepID=A0AAE1KC30_PETCI|nr:hypothetical protein Pcinc_025084 [Petrolisthes cinctipes]
MCLCASIHSTGVMKSFLNIGVAKTGPALESPRPASGILPHQDEKALAKLWLDMAKAEAGCCRVMEEVGKYREAIRSTQEAEEQLLKGLGASNLTATNPELRKVTDEYLSVIVEMREKSMSVGNVVQEVVGDPVRHYQTHYEHLDALRRRRDTQLATVQKTQDKLDKLKLKGKRTTDVLVERNAAGRQLKEINTQLLGEAGRFHALRLPLLQTCLQALVQTQVDYYGTTNAHFSSQVEASRGAHLNPTSQYQATLASHLAAIKDLKIVAT